MFSKLVLSHCILFCV